MKRVALSVTCLTVFLFTVPCACQSKESKARSLNDAKVWEAGGAESRKWLPSDKESHEYVPGQILVKFRRGTDEQTIEAIQEQLDLKTIKIISSPGLYLVEILDGSSVESVMKRLKDFQEVVYSEPNHIVTGY